MERKEGATVSYAEGEEEEKQPSEVERILRETDMNNLSPMQAFMILSDLVEKVK